MLLPIELFTTMGLVVLTIGVIAMMLKLVLLGLAVDDWYELREASPTLPEKMVADDELVSGIGRLISVMTTVAVGIIWVVIALNNPTPNIRLTPLVLVIPLAIGIQAALACWQGARGLLFRRRLARVLSGRRRSSAEVVHREAVTIQ